MLARDATIARAKRTQAFAIRQVNVEAQTLAGIAGLERVRHLI